MTTILRSSSLFTVLTSLLLVGGLFLTMGVFSYLATQIVTEVGELEETVEATMGALCETLRESRNQRVLALALGREALENLEAGCIKYKG